MANEKNEFVGIKMPADLVREARRQAAEDDRTLSAFLRRLIAAKVTHQREPQQDDRD